MLKVNLTAALLRLALILSGTFLLSCAVGEKKFESNFEPRYEYFRAPFDKVWRAAQLALANYPVKNNDMDTGAIETQEIRGYALWKPPHIANNQKSSALRYSLLLKVSSVRNKNKRATKVSISKRIKKYFGSFRETKNIPSDGLEEETLIYRIERELKIERALEKAADS